MTDFNTRIVVDGNDGTGKTTLVRSLRLLGFRNVHDRGEMTKATDDCTAQPEPGTIYILLTCPWRTSLERLTRAGRDLSDPYHQPAALAMYEARFLALVKPFNAKVIVSLFEDQVLMEVVRLLNVPIRLGLPTGRLQYDHPGACLVTRPKTRLLVDTSTCVPVTGVWIRSKTYPKMVALGSLDVAVVGSDALEGNPWADMCEVIERVPQPGLRMCLAAPMSLTLRDTPLLRVATPYPEWAAMVLGEMGKPCSIFQVDGGSEALVAAGLADACFDIVETGETLSDNGLNQRWWFGGVDVCVIRRR